MSIPIPFMQPRSMVGKRFRGHAIPLDMLKVDPLDVVTRLETFHALRDGWLDGKGFAPKREGLDWFATVFEEYYPEELPMPYLYPTAEGGIQAEWSVGQQEVTLEVNLDTHQGKWHILNMETEKEDVRPINLDDRGGWQWVVDRIRELTVESAK